jgi:predicted permease
MNHGVQAASTYLTYRTHAHTIDGIGIYAEDEVNVRETGSTRGPERVTVAECTASLLVVLGVAPLRGRLFNEADDRPSAAPVVLISEGMWRAQFGGDPAIVGRMLEVNAARREIIGVMPRGFRFPSAETEMWIPLALDPAHLPETAFSYNSVARLKAGVTVADAQRDFTVVLPRVAELFPDFVPGISTAQMLEQVKPRPVITTLHHDVTGEIAGTLWTIAAAAGLLLLVACVNVANLTVVRFDARQRELAVREALGAGRARLVRYYFSESVVLAGVACLMGLALAWGMIRTLLVIGPSGIPRLAEVGIDAASVWFAVAIAGLAAVASSVIPALRIGRGGIALREGARGNRSGTASRAQHRVRSALVAAQVAVGLVVLAGSGLLVRSFQRLHDVRPGFDPEHVATVWMSLPGARYESPSEIARFYSALVDRVSSLPGARRVGVTSRLPLVARGMNHNPFYPEDQPKYATKLPPLQLFTTVGGEYFRAIGIPLVAGKLFDRMDAQRPGDAIISRRTAEIFWNDSTGVAALGKRFRGLPTDPWYTVVGVVENVRDTALAVSPAPTVYFPEIIPRDSIPRQTRRTMALVVKTTGEATSMITAIQRAVREIDPTLPTFAAQSMTEVLRASTARLAFIIVILGVAAVVTLILGAVGLYGVMAYVVTLRRRELGIRIALGASPRAVVAATTGQGIALTCVGVAGGLVLFILTARFLQAFLFGIAPWDPLTIASAALMLLAIATLASWIPARRSGRVDPAEALRAE